MFDINFGYTILAHFQADILLICSRNMKEKDMIINQDIISLLLRYMYKDDEGIYTYICAT